MNGLNTRTRALAVFSVFLVTAFALLGFGCSKVTEGTVVRLSAEEQPRNFFATKGIVVGTPVDEDGGNYQIPIRFQTKDLHSALAVSSVTTSVKGSDILVTAEYAVVKNSHYPGYVEQSGITAGTYDLKYRDPDGTLHPVESVKLP